MYFDSAAEMIHELKEMFEMESEATDIKFSVSIPPTDPEKTEEGETDTSSSKGSPRKKRKLPAKRKTRG